MNLYAFNSSNKIKSSKILFHGKRLYRNEVMKQNQASFIDFWYSKPLYGKVDLSFHPIIASPSVMGELNVGEYYVGSQDSGNPRVRTTRVSSRSGARFRNPYALNFVADAFNAMSGYLAELVTKRRLVSTPDCFFFPLEAQRGWIRPNKLYSRHLTFLYDMFIRRYLMANSGRLNREMTDFKKYLQIFVDFVNYATDNGVPITRSGYVTNLGTSHAVSGLVIEISKDSDKSDDGNKYLNYFSNPQIDIYYDVAKKFGFYIDMNVPWRLVANLNSTAWNKNPYLIRIVDKYFENGYNIEDVFDKYYTMPSKTDFDSLKMIAMQFYNSVVTGQSELTKPHICSSSGRIVSQKMYRNLMLKAELEDKYDNLFWLRLYMQLRMKEMQIDVSRQDMKSELSELRNMYHSTGDHSEALEHVEDRTSLYLKKQAEKHAFLRQRGRNLLTPGQTPDIIL